MTLAIKNVTALKLLFVVMLVALLLWGAIPQVTALLVLGLMGTLSFYQTCLDKNKPVLIGIFWAASIILGVTVGLYRPTDFTYPIVFNTPSLYEGGLPFRLYLNTGVACAGYCILLLMRQSSAWKPAIVIGLGRQYFLSVVMAICVLAVAYLVLGLQIHIKQWSFILYFAAVNLLVTCVAEEAFMRLLLQAQLQQFISRSISRIFISELAALLIATFLFVLTHFTPTLKLTLVYALAGFCYGLVYTLTKNIWASVLLHFLVNFVHFSLLTYPLM